MKTDLDTTGRVSDISRVDNLAEEKKIESRSVPAPLKEEINSSYHYQLQFHKNPLKIH